MRENDRLGEINWNSGDPPPRLSAAAVTIMYKAYRDVLAGRWTDLRKKQEQQSYEQFRSMINEAFVTAFPRHDYGLMDMQELWEYIFDKRCYTAEFDLQDYILEREAKEKIAEFKRYMARLFGTQPQPQPEIY